MIINMNKNDEFTLEITGMTADGNGVGHSRGMAVFVPGSAIGDIIKVHIIKVFKKYSVAKIINIETSSADRISVDCGCFNQCGGCVYRHISYEAECKIKWQRVYDAFKRIGKLSAEQRPIISAMSQDKYRNKAQYPVGQGPVFGFYAPHSHRIIEVSDCKLQPDEFKRILDVISAFLTEKHISIYNEETGEGIVRHIYLRKGFISDEIMACIVINSDKMPFENELCEKIKSIDSVTTLLLNSNTEKTNVVLGEKNRILFGCGYITDILCGIKVEISPLSFYQVNHEMAEILYKKVSEYAGNNIGVLLDLYCGTGTIGLSIADKAEKVIGVEIVPEAINDARKNAEINQITNVEFICATAESVARKLADEQIKSNTVIVDPPRRGLESELISTITDKIKPERIVYVSCDPGTLARDLNLFEQNGYKTIEATPIDLFPRTAHVETVCLLRKEYNE